ncbi:DNA topoisomerase I, mitochondrial isoform X1 [Pontoporia blainvillei]|uniref:DNA topoisomerase I, mitochondrial isoform X1 n=1 Tax=Pontoporia blainvillei TaxID=48723 RepID=A0ABX0SCI7_PONBL|nr:DNA topoisomerase I, mitochondrial isoform X1 [Pontoporia blainvillei]
MEEGRAARGSTGLPRHWARLARVELGGASMGACAPPSLASFLEKRGRLLERLEEQLGRLSTQAADKEKSKQVALGTSKLNYLDPRISVAWCVGPGRRAHSWPRRGDWTPEWPQFSPLGPVVSTGPSWDGTRLAGVFNAESWVTGPLCPRALGPWKARVGPRAAYQPQRAQPAHCGWGDWVAFLPRKRPLSTRSEDSWPALGDTASSLLPWAGGRAVGCAQEEQVG